MAKSVLELAVGTGQWDAGLKKAKSALDNFTQSQGGLQSALAKDSENMRKFVQMMGKTESTAKTAKGQMNDYKSTIEQLTMQYNRMTEAQKKVIGQDYLQAIEQMKQKYQSVNEEIQEMNRSLNKVKLPDMKDGGGGLFSGLGDKMSGALQVFAGNMLTKAAGAVASLGSEIADMVQQGVELAKQGEGIRIAFERLGRGDILDGLREATHGTVTDLELMKAAVKFNDFKLPVEELGTMLAFAQQKAKDTGQSVDYMVDSIVTGLGRKSLMILDNLGLSANDIKEKMAETGDMTKAVGEIIREQMAKSGEYTETAADRATQAEVQLENAMEQLGRTFAPLQEAGVSLFTSWKISALNFIKDALEPLIARFTEAGRLQAAYNRQGGSEKVNRMANTLQNTPVDKRQGLYNTQVNNFNRFIKERQEYINLLNSYRAGSRGEGNGYTPENKARIDQMFKRFGTDDTSRLQSQIDGATKQLQEYQKVAKELLKPAEANIDTKHAEQSVESLKVKLIELEAQRKKAIEAGDTDLSKSLAKQISQVKADIKGLDPNAMKTTHKATKQETAILKNSIGDYEKQIKELRPTEKDVTTNEEWEALQHKIGELTIKVKELKGELKTVPASISEDTNKATDAQNKKMQDRLNDPSVVSKGMANIVKQISKEQGKEEKKYLVDGFGKLAGGLGGIQSGFQQMGIDLGDGFNAVVGGLQGITTILTAIQTIVSAIEIISSADAIFPLARGGVVHAAGGYVVPGHQYSGDLVPAALSSGEMVLNKQQQMILAGTLENGGMKNISISGHLDGETIALSVDRWGKRSGRGELAFWKNQ